MNFEVTFSPRDDRQYLSFRLLRGGARSTLRRISTLGCKTCFRNMDSVQLLRLLKVVVAQEAKQIAEHTSTQSIGRLERETLQNRERLATLPISVLFCNFYANAIRGCECPLRILSPP